MSELGSKKINLRPLWDALLNVYKVFSEICDGHGLQYCADCGTALGAVRHQGFIPWDDDMDIQMPRPDYEKFVEIAKKELPVGLAWLDHSTCSEYDNGFGKLIVTDREVVDHVSRESGLGLGQGIFVDVFPMDGYPDSVVARIWRAIQNYLVTFSVKYYSGWGKMVTLKSKLSFCIGALIRPFNYDIRNYRDQVEFYERRARKYVFGKTGMCVSIGCAQYYDDKPFPVSFIGETKRMPFDSVEMRVQENVDGYLKWIFGDYLKLPPISRRVGGHGNAEIVKWRLGPKLT